jgi:DNA-binding response OmpR family regulator
VVDNNPDNTLVVRIALEDNRFEVDAFNDPTEALSAFKRNLYDLLILNVLSGFGEQYAHEKGFDSLTSSSSSNDYNFFYEKTSTCRLLNIGNP